MMFNPGCCNCSSPTKSYSITILDGCGPMFGDGNISVTFTDSQGNIAYQNTALPNYQSTLKINLVPYAKYHVHIDPADYSSRFGVLEKDFIPTLTPDGLTVDSYIQFPTKAGFVCVGCNFPLSATLQLSGSYSATLTYQGTHDPGGYFGSQGDPNEPYWAGSGYEFGKANNTETGWYLLIPPEPPFNNGYVDSASFTCPPAYCPSPSVHVSSLRYSNYTFVLDEVVAGCGGGYTMSTSNPMMEAMHFSAGRSAALPPSSALRVGLIAPCFLLGGAEAWELSLVDAISSLLGSLVSFTGAVVIDQSQTNPTALADLAALAPVTYGFDAAHTLAGQVDVIVTWTVLDYAALYAGLASAPKTIFVCHLPSPWGSGSATMLAPVDAFVAVSEFAQQAIPAALQSRSTVIWNAIDAARLT